MPHVLTSLHTWLTDQYRSVGIDLGGADSLQASWLPIPDDPLAADLLDSQLGAWVKFRALPAAGAGLGSLIQDDVRKGLDELSRLEIRSGSSDDSVDQEGAWQIHLIWIARDDAAFAEWQREMARLRARSGYADELGFDVIQLHGKSVQDVLREQGVPCLLFKTRALLRLDANDLPRWQSPDPEFAEALRKLPEAMPNPLQKQFVQNFVDQQLANPRQQAAAMPLTAQSLGSIKMANFKNIVEAELCFEGTKAELAVIHGPNGTGKSSLFEALSLALFGSSIRLRDFFEDKTDLEAKVIKDPINKLLRRFSAAAADSITLNRAGTDCLPSIARTFEEARLNHNRSRGTLLSQEEARQYLDLKFEELAGLVFSDYSVLAAGVRAAVDSGSEQAKAIWQDWLRSQGLNTSITVRATILERLIANALDHRFPVESQQQADWLQRLGDRFQSFKLPSSNLALRWSRLDSAAARSDVATSVANGFLAGVDEELLIDWLKQRDLARVAIASLVSDANTVLEPVRIQWPSLSADIQQMAAWIKTRTAQAVTAESPAGATPPLALQAKEAILRKALGQLADNGEMLRKQREHLELVLSGLLPAWQMAHANQCPTCNAEHIQGIDAVVKDLLADVTQRHQTMREQYAIQAADLKTVQQRLGIQDKPPLTPERVQEIDALLGYPQGSHMSVEAELRSNGGDWRQVIEAYTPLLGRSVQSPALGEEACAEQARQTMAEVSATDLDGVAKREQPERWKELKSAVDKLATDLVDRHLPRTLGAVWAELASALAPARWNQAVAVELKLQPTARGRQRLGFTLTADGATMPARHVLNQAEQHVLGMAWFLTRHLSHGRFVVPLLAMDDPAQEMDQPTYRRFVRFLQALLRMHRTMGKPLHALVMLHQEDRALDLARAATAQGTLTVLQWSREMQWHGPEATVQQIQLRNPQQRAPRPRVLTKPANNETATSFDQ